ncbi:MAG: V-type ATP synthase subunit F [Clostridia bacterium]|nr:V-type ATP synthase subunit F [Clostridia bacterium]
MRKDSISVIGDKDSVLAFKAIGINAYAVTELQEAREMLKTLARNYKVIFIIDEFAVRMQDLLARYKSRPYPTIIPLPSSKGSNGFGIMGIHKDVEKAIGTDILFGREDK